MSVCNSPFLLKEINIIGGDYQEILLLVSDMSNGESLAIEDLTLNFSLVEYKNRYGTPLINRNCAINSDGSAFIITLYPEDTKDFSGKYIYQISVQAPNNKRQSFQGIMTIDKNINPNAFINSTTDIAATE